NEESLQRLKVLKGSDDGFKISESDYEMRGGGDFLGLRQSGKFMSDLGELKYSVEALFTAKKIVDDFFSGGYDVASFKEIAMQKYLKLKDITLN
ncbi:MAG: hypothetical protein MJ072_06950, partial [Clostridia bacterium]|nr:hypothetical protein [Clostridia bacterium]